MLLGDPIRLLDKFNGFSGVNEFTVHLLTKSSDRPRRKEFPRCATRVLGLDPRVTEDVLQHSPTFFRVRPSDGPLRSSITVKFIPSDGYGHWTVSLNRSSSLSLELCNTYSGLKISLEVPT